MFTKLEHPEVMMRFIDLFAGGDVYLRATYGGPEMDNPDGSLTAYDAMASLMVLPVIILAFFSQRYLVQGLTMGAIKA